MTDREKLVEILNTACIPDNCEKYGKKRCFECNVEHLLANGVTFAKDTNVPSWIPVTERLPEDDLPKNSKTKQIKVITALISDNGVRTVRSQMRYKDTWYDRWVWKYSASKITHWMLLPEPPKEET